MAINLDDYNDVPSRIAEFREKYPEATLQSEYEFVQADSRDWVVVKAQAYRTPDDPRPGVGLAFEQIPGKTPYTKDSELQNAETAAWGRAIIAVGAADARKIASREEVEARQRPVPPDERTLNRQYLMDLAALKGWDLEKVAAAYAENNEGRPLKDASSDEFVAFTALLKGGVIKLG